MNKEKYLLYNFQESLDPANKKYYDLVRYALDARVYYFGNNFKAPFERNIPLKEKIKSHIIDFGISCFVFFKSIFYKKTNKINLLSTAYFNVNDLIKKDHLSISRPAWAYSKSGKDIYDIKIYRKARLIKQILNNAHFNYLVSQDFFDTIKEFEIIFKQFILENNIKALLLPHDIGFFEKLSIQIFKELNLPTFNFIHGLPGVYNIVDYNRADYLVVWGQAIKENFVNIGYNPDKILISGHPKYTIKTIDKLKFGFDKILVLPKSLCGQQNSVNYVLADRSNLIYYLKTIQSVLINFGVSQVRFRPHPGDNAHWYTQFLDNDFFKIDTDDLATSINKSSLLIGSTSTVFFESLIAGVNYVVYEPRLDNDMGLDGHKIVPPFDGNNTKVPTATNTQELNEILKAKKQVDTSIIQDYIAPFFDASEILDLVMTGKTNK